MKKIVLFVSAIVLSITLVVLIVLLSNSKKTIIVKGILEKDELSLGKQKVFNYHYDKINGESEVITFTVKSPNSFYNNVIKQNDFYNENLVFDRDDLLAYGFLTSNESIFSYEIKENGAVKISSVFGSYYDHEKNNNYYIPGPFSLNISADKLLDEEEMTFKYYSKPNDDWLANNFDALKQVVCALPSSFYSIVDDYILIKGECISYQDSKEEIVLSHYLLKIYEDNNAVRITHYN